MLIVENLVVRYANRPKPALNHLTTTVDQSLCIIGPSGAGKSTWLKALMGLIPAQSGSMRLEGVDITKRPLTARRLMAYMPQENLLPKESTLNEYLQELAALDFYPAAKRTPAVQQILALMHLQHVGDRRLAWLSGGMKRRALLAGTLLRRTPWLLLDEPTLGLDPGEQASVRTLIRHLSQHRRIIMTTQFVADATAIPQRILLLKDGNLVREITWTRLQDLAQGHVVRRQWTSSGMGHGIQWIPEPGGRTVRALVEAPQPDDELVPPTVEEGYLWAISQARLEP